MGKSIKLLVILSLCVIFLSACEGKHFNNQSEKSSKSSIVTKESKKKVSSSQDNGSNQSNNENQNTEGLDTKSGDQLELKLGDTANVKTNISHFLLTVSSIKLTNKPINSHTSELDSYLRAEISIKNIGENTIKADEAISNLELTDVLKETGISDESIQLGISNAINGKIKPGQTKKGEAIFEVYNAKKYYLVTNPGDVATSLINNIRFTFSASEAK